MPAGHRIAATEGEIFTEYNMFQLADIHSLPTGDLDSVPAAPSDDDLVTVKDNYATFNSALADNYPYVVIEYWSAEPPDAEGAWERLAERKITFEGGQLRLFSQIDRRPGQHELQIPPGRYHMRVWCRGRKQAQALAESDDMYPHSVEHWLIRLWPY